MSEIEEPEKPHRPHPSDNWTWRPGSYFEEQQADALFPERSEAPLEIDLGSGDGSFLLEMAERHPDRNFLGVERLLGRVRKTARKLWRAQDGEGSPNGKVARLDSGYLIGWLLTDESVDRIHLLCPDPWPKKKHHKNRFVRDEDFHRGLQRKLKPEGLFLFKTDHPGYFEDGCEQMDALPFLGRAEWPEGEFYAETDFERQWKGEGKSIQQACWRRMES